MKEQGAARRPDSLDPATAQAAPPAGRPSVDVVVPFAGGAFELEALVCATRDLKLRAGDSLTIVDNRPDGDEVPAVDPPARIIRARDRQSSYFARNRGAAGGEADWLLFIDADVEAPADLLERYFARHVAPETALLAGGIVDVQTGSDSLVGRFLTESSSMSQANTLTGEWSYAQTANCAVRRAAFDEVGGFADHIRSGGDADLCFRLRAAGWKIERQNQAAVEHRARTSVRAMVAQRARHGSGAAWLNRVYPGSFPAAPWLGLVKWTGVQGLRALSSLARGDRASLARVVLDSISAWALQLGRLGSNDVPAGR